MYEVTSTSMEAGFWTQFIKEADKQNRARAQELWEIARELVSVPWNGIPSRPGEAPRMRTGTGRESIQMAKASDGSYDVYIEQPYIHMVYLNLGTENMEARPWLRLAEEKLNNS